jgi:hypothetical protein
MVDYSNQQEVIDNVSRKWETYLKAAQANIITLNILYIRVLFSGYVVVKELSCALISKYCICISFSPDNCCCCSSIYSEYEFLQVKTHY